jgi:hypothetical protein
MTYSDNKKQCSVATVTYSYIFVTGMPKHLLIFHWQYQQRNLSVNKTPCIITREKKKKKNIKYILSFA